MVRPREFDEVEVLDKALFVFWHRGFEGCSIGDLIDATGLQRQSLYNVFGDKHGLFLAALKRYQQRSEEQLESLRTPNAGLAELRKYMESVLEGQRAGGFGACLMVKTAFGPERVDPAIRAAVETTAGSVRQCFANVIERAVRARKLPAQTEPESYAAYLFTVLNGLSALVQTGGAFKQIDSVLDQIFGGKPLKSKRS